MKTSATSGLGLWTCVVAHPLMGLEFSHVHIAGLKSHEVLALKASTAAMSLW